MKNTFVQLYYGLLPNNVIKWEGDFYRFGNNSKLLAIDDDKTQRMYKIAEGIVNDYIRNGKNDDWEMIGVEDRFLTSGENQARTIIEYAKSRFKNTTDKSVPEHHLYGKIGFMRLLGLPGSMDLMDFAKSLEDYGFSPSNLEIRNLEYDADICSKYQILKEEIEDEIIKARENMWKESIVLI